jgi:hypothetical protein
MTQPASRWQISDILQSTNLMKRFFIYESSKKYEALSEENDLRTLVDTDDFKFHLVYQSNKMLGYSFEFTKEPIYANDRTAIFMFDERKTDPKVDVLFEDQIVRLLTYNQLEKINRKNGKVEEVMRRPDYWLVCRWRY